MLCGQQPAVPVCTVPARLLVLQIKVIGYISRFFGAWSHFRHKKPPKRVGSNFLLCIIFLFALSCYLFCVRMLDTVFAWLWLQLCICVVLIMDFIFFKSASVVCAFDRAHA